jgi:hypothetical protein
MAKQFVILCSVQRLPYQDNTDAAGPYYAFGLNLSAAIGVDDNATQITSAEAAALRPWLWTAIDNVRATTLDGVTSFPCDLIKPQNPPALDWTRLQTELQSEYDENEPDLASVVSWRLPVLGTSAVDRRQTLNLNPTAGDRKKPWHATILQLSTYPYPIPQQLNLSFIVKVPQASVTDPAQPLLLAPIIKADVRPAGVPKPYFDVDITPTGTPEQVDSRKVYKWTYDHPSANGLAVAAYLKPIVVTDTSAPAPTYIDLATGWVKKVSGGDFYEEDWRAYLESRLGEAFDLSERLIDFLRTSVARLKPMVTPPAPEEMPFFERMVICTIRDLAGTGLLPSLNGNTLVDDLLGPDPGKRLSAARLNEIRAVEKTLFDVPANPGPPAVGPWDSAWRKFLADSIPELSKLAILNPITRDRNRPPEESLADLEQLHKAIMDPKNLHVLVQEQWKQIIPKVNTSTWDAQSISNWNTFQEKVSGLTPEFNYRGRLASCALGPIWNAFRSISGAAPTNPLDIRQLLPSLMASHLQARLKLTPEVTQVTLADYDKYFPECRGDANAALVDRVIVDLKETAQRIVDGIIPVAGPSAKTTDIPHPVALQAHLTAMLPPEASALDNVLGQVSGVVVFMRDRQENTWRCLNYADASVRGSAQTGPVVVPSRINYQNGLTQSLVTYNNVPLAAQSPLAAISTSNNNTTVKPAVVKDNKPPLIKYDYFKNPIVPNDPRTKIKALVFRDPASNAGKYDAVMCTVSTSGALPRELTVQNNPWTIDQGKLASLNFPNPDDLFRSFSYVRKVRIGQMRSKSDIQPGQRLEPVGKNNPLHLPLIPDMVRPIAHELPAVSDQGGAPQILIDQFPLLLLVPDNAAYSNCASSFSFQIRKPATDVETWHRWANEGSANKPWRAGVLADYYRKSEANRNLASNLARTDISFDDPAVKDFYVSVQRVNSDGTLTHIQNSPRRITIPAPALTNSMLDVQSAPLQVICKGNETGTASLVESAGAVTINGIAGEVYWTRVHGTIASADKPRFAGVVSQEFPTESGGSLLSQPMGVIIEVATKELPSAGEVWTGLTPEFRLDDGLSGDHVQLSIRSNDTLFRNVYRAELQRQSWYWRGRETRLFPATNAQPKNFVNADLLNSEATSGPPGLSQKIRDWEGFEFAGREPTDFTILDFEASQTTAPIGGKKEWFAYVEQLTAPKGKPELSEQTNQEASDRSGEKGNLRASYYRFSSVVYSRYEGVIADPNARFRQALNPDASAAPFGKWRRLFVPCRHREAPPVPHVKLIVPLTDSYLDTDTNRSPGLLVVLDESWHEFGGLGETIVAEVETLADPHNPSTIPDPCPTGGASGIRTYFEIGPDPILDGRSNPIFQASPTGGLSTVSLQNVRGPVGHTHDVVDDGARFTASSFIIPAPLIKPSGGANPSVTDLSWYMCKVRLQRIVRLKDAESTAPGAVMRSTFTEPQWVQYLPNFSLFADAKTTGDLRVKLDASGIFLINNGGSVVKASQLSRPNEQSAAVFCILLLLTRIAYDASGRPNQEVYVSVCQQSGDGWAPFSNDITPASLQALIKNQNVRFRARVVELQAVPSEMANGKPKFPTLPGTSKELFDRLFAFKQGTDFINDLDRMRVVRISQPIKDSRPA